MTKKVSECNLDTKDIELFNSVIQKMVEKGIEIEKIETILKSEGFFNKIINSTNSVLSEEIYQYIIQHSEENCEIIRTENKEFEAKISLLWKDPFELFETLIYVSQEIGNEFNNEFRQDAVKNNDFVFEALIHLHGRACQIALEILKLMQSGFPDGAIARWRTLHEIAIISTFIQNMGNDTAERYLLHDAIESYNSIEKYIRKPEIYKKHQSILDNPLPSFKEMNQVKKIKITLCEKFGRGYEKDWGWAANIIDDPNFSKIEEYVAMDHLRPYYKMANISTHAGSKGIRFHLTSPNKNLIHAGPGNMGMADPGQLAAISLLQVNTTLLITKPSIRRLSDILALTKLIQEIKKSFIKVHTKTMITYEEKCKLGILGSKNPIDK
jgi:hypothetical protein